MSKFFKFIIPILLIAVILGSIGWYLLVFDREFTRDILLQQARLNDLQGHTQVSAWFYNLAYVHSGKDQNVAIELANQYKNDGNYTKAEVTLSNAIKASPTAELYAALSKAYVDQDKLMDAVALLAGIPDAAIKAQLESQRPTAPTADQLPGFYSTYIQVALSSSKGRLHYTLDGEFPSMASSEYTAPITLSGGETVIHCISVDDTGLVSPVSVLGYTVGGVIEPITFVSAEVERAVREQLNIPERNTVYSNDLWNIKTFVLPSDVETLEDIAQMAYLEKLTIRDQNLESLAPLSSLKELKTLDVTHSRFPADELSILADLPALTELTLSDCSLSTIAALEGVKNLHILDISNNTVRNLEVLSEMTELQELQLSHNAINTLKPLAELKKLEKLNISHNAVTSLSPISTCEKLNWLNASSNQLSSAEGISSLPELATLALDYNNLSETSDIDSCVQLKELSISNNSITDISGLAGLIHLEVFDFSYNAVEELPEWPEGCALRIIEGSHNSVSSIAVLGTMENLTYVSMEYNKITSVKALAKCNNLVQVNVYGNEIQSVSALTEHNIIVNYDPT